MSGIVSEVVSAILAGWTGWLAWSARAAPERFQLFPWEAGGDRMLRLL